MFLLGVTSWSPRNQAIPQEIAQILLLPDPWTPGACFSDRRVALRVFVDGGLVLWS